MTLMYTFSNVDLTFFDENDFNKQPSFTVKNPCLQLVKIDHMISVYLSVTGTVVQKNIIYLWLSLQQIQTTAYINHELQNNFY